MNRNEEYWALVAELGETPPALDGTVAVSYTHLTLPTSFRV